MINKRFMKYAPVFGFVALAAAFMVIKGMPFITAFVYSMLVVGGVSIGSCATNIVSDVFGYFRKDKMVTMTIHNRVDRSQKGENDNEV